MKRTIVVRLPNPMGDAVAATSLLLLLRRTWPEARLAAAGRRPLFDLLAGLDCFDQAVPWDDADLAGRASPWRQAAGLRRLDAGAILLLPNSHSSAWAAVLAGIPQRIGRRGQGRGLLLTTALPPIRRPRAMTEIYGELAAPLLEGSLPPLPEIELRVTAAERLAAEQALAEIGWTGGGAWLAVAAGAAFGPSKVYPPELLARALTLIQERSGLRPLLLGPPAEARLARSVTDRFPAARFLPCGLGVLKAVLARSRALLSMDNGTRHVAAALGIPQVVLYGPTDPRWTAFALARTHRLRRTELLCSPCHLERCPIDQRCLSGLHPAAVAEAVAAALDLPPAASGPGQKESRGAAAPA